MVEGRTYVIVLVDGEEVWGEYCGENRGFWLMKVDNSLVPVRPSSAAVLTECES